MELNPDVYIQKLPPEKQVPERNAIESLEKFFDFVGAITKPSKRDGRERSFAERAERAKMLRDLEKINQERKRQERDIGSKNSERTEEIKMVAQIRKREIIDRAKNLQEIGNQYQNQHEITVNMGVLGEQKARMVKLTPSRPESNEVNNTKRKRYFIVPGASNDIDCVGSLARELAVSGVNVEDVTVMGYPEARLGQVTSEFADAVEKNASYALHAEFFKKAMLGLIKEGEEIELIGHSLGGAIAQEMLTDVEFSKHVSNAIIISPINSVNQTSTEFTLGTINEIKTAFSRELPRYTLSNGLKEMVAKKNESEAEKIIREEKSLGFATQLDRGGKIFNSHMTKMLKEAKLWPQVKVKEGGVVTYISAVNDLMTKAFRIFNKETEPSLRQMNPQIRVETVGGTHMGAFIHPEETVQVINKLQARAKNT